MRSSAIAGALALVMASVLVSAPIGAEQAGAVSWYLDGGTLIIEGEGAISNYSAGSQPWYGYRDSITGIEIENGVTAIGRTAFCDLPNVVSVSIPGTVLSVSDNAFQYCTSLESIVIPDTVTMVGRYVFDGCTSLETAYFGDGAGYIGRYCFQNCSSLTDIHVGSNVASIGNYTFAGCTALETISLPDSVTSIGTYAFYQCASLTSIDPGNGIAEIQDHAFCESGLTEISIPDSCTEIWNNAFCECSQLEYVRYPSDITYVGASCFYNCSSLREVDLGDAITEIRDSAFQSCTSLSDIWLPESTVTLGKNAFKGCSSLTEITFYEDLTSIGQYSFQNCTALRSLTVGSGLSEIGNGAFNGCTITEVRSCSSLDFVPGAITYGSIARNCGEIVAVEPYTVEYTDGSVIATQTAYTDDDVLTFRIHPRDPSRDGCVFTGWSDGSSSHDRKDTVSLPVDDAVLSATWASLVIAVTGDDQYAVSGTEIQFPVAVEGLGVMEFSTSCSHGSVSCSDGLVTHTPPETDSIVSESVTVGITNCYAEDEIDLNVTVAPVLEFIGSPSQGMIEVEV